jgi:hypothetical protein
LWIACLKKRVSEASSNGRQFASLIDRLGWPAREIAIQLRKGSTALHLHDLRDEGAYIRTLPHRCLYARPQAKLHLSCPRCEHSIAV